MNAAAAQTAAVMKIYNALKAGAKLAPCGSRMNEWRLQAAGTDMKIRTALSFSGWPRVHENKRNVSCCLSTETVGSVSLVSRT